MKKVSLIMVTAVLFAASAFSIDISAGVRGNLNLGMGTTSEKFLQDQMTSTQVLTALASGTSVKNISMKEKANVGGGFGAYGNFLLLDLGMAALGVQPEVNVNFNNGCSIFADNGRDQNDAGYKSNELKVYSNTIDIPLLVTVTIPMEIESTKKLEIVAGAGPQISIPFGMDAVFTTVSGQSSSDYKYSTDNKVSGNVNYGLAFDLGAKLYFGNKTKTKKGKKKVVYKYAAVLDVRYNLDLTKTQMTLTPNNSNTSTKHDVYTRRGLNVGIGGEYRF